MSIYRISKFISFSLSFTDDECVTLVPYFIYLVIY